MRRYVKFPIIVEGKYDKAHLASFLDAQIYTTDGFSIYDSARQKQLLDLLSHSDSVIIMTDSDRAGFRIRGHLSGIIKDRHIIHIYLPRVSGRERRKPAPSAEGFLGVEGIDSRRIIAELERQGAFGSSTTESFSPTLFYELGLSGGDNSSELRNRLAEQLGLPTGMSSSALRKLLPKLLTELELRKLVAEFFL